MWQLLTLGLVLSINVMARDIECGDEVLEHRQELSLQHVVEILNNRYLLEDDVWYDSKEIDTFQDSYRTLDLSFMVGDEVLRHSGGPQDRPRQEILRVEKIASDTKFTLLSDGRWYSPYDISQLVSKKQGFSIGQERLLWNRDGTFEKTKVINIAKSIRPGLYPLFQAENGRWYRGTWLKKSVPKYSGISVGDFVRERGAKESVQRVVQITDDGHFQLEDGNWYWKTKIRRVR